MGRKALVLLHHVTGVYSFFVLVVYCLCAGFYLSSLRRWRKSNRRAHISIPIALLNYFYDVVVKLLALVLVLKINQPWFVSGDLNKSFSVGISHAKSEENPPRLIQLNSQTKTPALALFIKLHRRARRCEVVAGFRVLESRFLSPSIPPQHSELVSRNSAIGSEPIDKLPSVLPATLLSFPKQPLSRSGSFPYFLVLRHGQDYSLDQRLILPRTLSPARRFHAPTRTAQFEDSLARSRLRRA
jgi:hypothetical protein